jgi:hypothetical protein
MTLAVLLGGLVLLSLLGVPLAFAILGDDIQASFAPGIDGPACCQRN